jgi:hypothetical protein
MEIGTAYADAPRPNERMPVVELWRRSLLELEIARLAADKRFDEFHVNTRSSDDRWGKGKSEGRPSPAGPLRIPI